MAYIFKELDKNRVFVLIFWPTVDRCNVTKFIHYNRRKKAQTLGVLTFHSPRI